MPRALVIVGWILAASASLATISSWYMDRECRTSGRYCEIVSEISRVVPFLDRMSAEAGACLAEKARAAELAYKDRSHVVGCVTLDSNSQVSFARFIAAVASNGQAAAFDQFSCYSPDWTQIAEDLEAGTLAVACNWPPDEFAPSAKSVLRVYLRGRLGSIGTVLSCNCKQAFLRDLAYSAGERVLKATLETNGTSLSFDGAPITVPLGPASAVNQFYDLSIKFAPGGGGVVDVTAVPKR